jgi:glycosyl transferase family 1
LSQETSSDRVRALKPALAAFPRPDPLWNAYVEDFLPDDAGSLRAHLAMLKLARGRRALLLNGASGWCQKYRDLIFAMLVKFMPRRPPILMFDATWEPYSEAVVERFPLLRPILPRLARIAIAALDGPHVTYAVLSTSELRSFPQTWGVDPARVVFQPFPNTLHEYRDMPTRDDGFLFSGGNSIRDYGLLEKALEGTTIPTRIAAKWQPSGKVESLAARPTTHDEFMQLLASSHAVVVPLRQTVRSAGQQTYLNAMGLGKPVVVTDAPGVRDYVIDGVTGVVVPPESGALRAALLHVMDPANAAYYEKMGRRAKAEVFNRFTEEHFRHGLLLHAGLITRKQFAVGKDPATVPP